MNDKITHDTTRQDKTRQRSLLLLSPVPTLTPLQLSRPRTISLHLHTRRPETFVKAKTVYALTPDTTGLDMKAPAVSHERCVCTIVAFLVLVRSRYNNTVPGYFVHSTAGFGHLFAQASILVYPLSW